MEAGVVQEVALDPPGLAIHLPPLRLRIDADLQTVQGQHPVAGLGWRPRRDDEPALALIVKQLLAVVGDTEGGDVFDEPLGLALVQVETV